MIIKAISPLFRYDGEPSVSTGIASQLPSSHLFIHWVPAKLSNRVYALWRILLPATALVSVWLFTDLTGSVQHSFSGRYAVPPLSRSSDDRDSFSPSPSGSFPEPCTTPDVSGTQQDPGISLSGCLCCCTLHALRIPDILQQFLRVILLPCLQYRIDHP